jgi:hypothetical protein
MSASRKGATIRKQLMRQDEKERGFSGVVRWLPARNKVISDIVQKKHKGNKC